VIHFTYKQPLVALCGAPLVNEPRVIDLAVMNMPPMPEPVLAFCATCEEERAAGRYCENGHVWRLDAMHGEPCQCRRMALLRDEDNDCITVVTVREDELVGGTHGKATE
jgi:hypothetical protein